MTLSSGLPARSPWRAGFSSGFQPGALRKGREPSSFHSAVFHGGFSAPPLRDYPVLIQAASLGEHLSGFPAHGSPEPSLLRALFSRSTRGRALAFCSAILLLGVTFFLGQFRIQRISENPSMTNKPVLRVAVIQPGVSQDLRWDEKAEEEIYRDLWRQTLRVAGKEKPDLILWPESASPLNWSWSYGLQKDLIEFTQRSGISIILNTVWSDEPQRRDAPFFNAALLVTPQGPEPPYFKQRLVPFGEYVPLRTLPPQNDQAHQPGGSPSSFSPGSGSRLLNSPLLETGRGCLLRSGLSVAFARAGKSRSRRPFHTDQRFLVRKVWGSKTALATCCVPGGRDGPASVSSGRNGDFRMG